MNKKKKFKYLLFSLFIAISFISCGGDNDNDDDDDVEVIDEQETTDEITGPNLLLCDNIDIQLAVVDNNVTLSWGGCSSTDNSEVTYIIYKSNEFYDCNSSSAMPQEGNIITTDNSINYNNLDFYKLYSFGIHASDVSGNTEYLGTVYQAFVPNDPIEEDIVFTNQLQVDSFIDGAITKIIGDLTIGASNCVGMGEVSSKIHNLEALSGLEEITGNLVIEGEYCDFITFSGLESLTNVGGDLVLNGVTSVGDLTINSPNLSSITALNNATTISNINLVNILSLNGFGQIALTGNLSINNINQTASNTFSQLRIVDELEILGLTPNNLNFVNNLEEINTSINIIGTSEIQTLNFTTVDSSNPLKITIQNNSSLLSIIGLNNTTQLKLATISSNSQLTTIAFLTSLAEITESSLEIIDNDQLTNLDALSNLNYIECPGQLIVTDNFNLGDLCGLQTLFTNNGLCSFKATIENNGYNPTPLQIENGDCSL